MSCGTVGCSSPDCPVCTVNARFVIVPCPRFVDGEACKKVAGHYPPCVATVNAGKVERADLKDSKPVVEITNEQAAIALAYKKRKREGAVRQQRG